MDFAVTVDYRENRKKANCNWYFLYSYQRIGTRTGGFGNKRTCGDNPNYSIDEIGQDTEKSTGDLMKLTVTLSQVEDHKLRLIRKNLYNNKN